MAKNTTVIEIGNKKYILTFGLEFLRLLNEKYTLNQNGFEISAGLPKAVSEIQFGNAEMIAEIIRFATTTLHDKPTDAEIEEYIYEQLDREDDFDLFEYFFDLLKKAPGAKAMLKRIENATEEVPATDTL